MGESGVDAHGGPAQGADCPAPATGNNDDVEMDRRGVEVGRLYHVKNEFVSILGTDPF